MTQLAAVAPSGIPLVCAQNGVRNEPEALRWFERVYGVVVMCPTVHLEPGVVAAYSSRIVGILDVGRYPHGQDEVTQRVSADRRLLATHRGRSQRGALEVRKLLTNLGKRRGGGIDGPRPGGSLWQSVSRGSPSTEVDYLCGEIVRLARLAGTAAPANVLLQRLTHDITAGRTPASRA